MGKLDEPISANGKGTFQGRTVDERESNAVPTSLNVKSDTPRNENPDKDIPLETKIEYASPNSEEFARQCISSSEDHPVSTRRKWCCSRNKQEPLSAWLLLMRVFFYNSLGGMQVPLFSLMYVEYSAHFRLPKGTLGWVDSIQHLVGCIVGLFVSWPIDRWGCHRMAPLGSMMSCLGLALASLAPNVVVLYLTQGLLTGIGLFSIFIPSSVIVQLYFRHNRALANGISLLGFSAGQFIGAYIISFLLDTYGWRGTLLLISAIIAHRIPIGMTYWPPPTTEQKIKDPQTTKQIIINLFKKAMDFSLLKNRAFLLFLLSIIAHKMCRFATMAHFPSFMIYRGYSLSEAAFLASIVAVSNTSHRVFVMFIANMKCSSSLVIHTIGFILAPTSITILLLCDAYAGLLAYVILMGSYIGFTNTVFTIVLLDLMGTERLSRSIALYNFVTGVASSIGTPLSGWLYDITGIYEIPYIVLGGIAILGAVLNLASYIVHRRKTRAKLGQKDLPDLPDDIGQNDEKANC